MNTSPIRHLNTFLASLLLILIACSDQKAVETLIDPSDISPWCIIGFDTENRTPEQRIEMLQEMGIKQYGYNRGKADFSSMAQEFQLASENDIDITSVFLWLNAKSDSIGKLSPSNRELLSNISGAEHKPAIWLSFSHNFFEERGHAESIEYCVEMIQFIKSYIGAMDCELALYNHHGWFGNPNHQIEVLKELNDESISIVYNFHHAQEYVDEFEELAEKMLPYLSFVNLNGVKKEGPQIIPIGQGNHEYDMIVHLKDLGYDGPWGILGHVKTEDVQKVLRANLDGLSELNKRYILHK